MKSFHYFLFPFRFDYLDSCVEDRHDFYKSKDFDKRVFYKLNLLFDELKKNNWEYVPFEFENNLSYNEFVYFHDFVKDSLFNINKKSDKNSTSYFFRKKLDDLKLILDIKKSKWIDEKEEIIEKQYELDLISITLRIFDTGIGILAFEIENTKYEDKEDVLNINEYFRRIYPPFVGDKFSFDELEKKYMGNFEIRSSTENKPLYSQNIKEDFKDIQNIKSTKISPYILEILGKNIFTQDIKDKNHFLIQSVIDERMFVMCWYGNDEMASLAKECWYECKDKEKREDKEKGEDNEKYWKLKDFWYEFLFVDANGKSIANKKMQEKILEKSTYLRWLEYGTLYGVSRYSFVNLTDTKAGFLLDNFKGVYYQMLILALAVRASVLRFSDEITAISDLKPDDELYERVSNLYKNYLRFVNKLYFREISPQDQAIEIYEIFQEIMKLQRDVMDLDNEIGKLVNYVYMIQEREENKEMKKLTLAATVLLPPSVIVGFFGMNVFGDKLSVEGLGWFLFVIILMIGSVIGAFYFVDKKKTKEFIKRVLNGNKNHTTNTDNSL